MEAHSHDSVCRVKSFLNAVTVVHIYIDIEHTIVVLEELKDGNNYIIYEAEPTSLRLFGVV